MEFSLHMRAGSQMAISRGRLHASAVDSNYSGRPIDGDFTNDPGELWPATAVNFP